MPGALRCLCAVVLALGGCSPEGAPASGSSSAAPWSSAAQVPSDAPSAASPSASPPASVSATSAAREEVAATSADGKMRAYVKLDPKLSIWSSTSDGRHARRELDIAGDPQLAGADSVADLGFSADRKRLYFRSFSSANATPLWSLELGAARVMKFAHHADAYRVVQACKDTKLVDTVLVLEERIASEGMLLATTWYWLYTSDKKPLGPVGPEDANVQRFFARKCGEGTAPPDPPTIERPAALKKLPLACGGSTIVGRTVGLLDGTSVEQLAIRDDTIPAAQVVPVGVTPERAVAFVKTQCP